MPPTLEIDLPKYKKNNGFEGSKMKDVKFYKDEV